MFVLISFELGYAGTFNDLGLDLDLRCDGAGSDVSGLGKSRYCQANKDKRQNVFLHNSSPFFRANTISNSLPFSLR